MKAVYIPVGAAGHVLASLPMVGELVARGVEMLYFAPEAFRAQVELTSAAFVPMPAVAAKDSSVDCGQDFIAGLPLVFLGEADGVIDGILPVIEAFAPDVVLADELALAGRLAAAKLRLPLIMIFTSFAPCETFSICRFWPEYTDANPARAEAKRIAERFTRKYGVRHLDIYEIFEGRGDFNISTLIRAIQPGGETFGDDFLFAGAQIGPRVEQDAWTPPQDGRPLLFTSLGSLFNNWPEFYQMLFPIVRELDVHVVCALGDALRPEDLHPVPDNVTLLPFAPQLQILPHTDCFITHAGTGSAMEALYFGAPCVCLPQMEEQQLTAARMLHTGIACASIARAELTPQRLAHAIDTALHDGAFLARAREASRLARAQSSAEGAAQAILRFMGG